MNKCIGKNCEQNKKCSLDKTGDGNMVLDLAILNRKYPKIVPYEKKIIFKFTCGFQNCDFLPRFYGLSHILSA